MKLSILCCLTNEEELNKATIEVFEKMAAYGLGKNNKVRIGEEFANAAGYRDLRLHSSTNHSVGSRKCHCSVSASLIKVVTEC